MDARRSRLFNGSIALLVLALAIAAAQAFAAAGGLDQSFSSDGRRTIGFVNGNAVDEGYAVALQHDGKIVVVGTSDQGSAASGFDVAVARFRPNGGRDQTFSDDGRKTIAFAAGNGYDEGDAVAIQPNGKIVVAGYTGSAGTYDFAVARLTPNGSPDPGFSGNGRKTIGFANGSDQAHAVALQRDGGIVVAGNSDQVATGTDFAVARFKPNGSLDQSFSSDGRRTIGFANGANPDSVGAMAIRGDGKIVVAGYSDLGSGAGGYNFALARFKPNGNLDPRFSNDGRRTIGFANGSGTDIARGVALQGDGKIVVAGGSAQAASGFDVAVARLQANGNPDPGFSGNGRKTIGFANGSGSDQAQAVALQGDGKIVVAGNSAQAVTGTDFALARLKPNGNLDHSFSNDGRRTTGFANGGGLDYGSALALQGSGKIVVAGYSEQSSTGEDFALARFLGV